MATFVLRGNPTRPVPEPPRGISQDSPKFAAYLFNQIRVVGCCDFSCQHVRKTLEAQIDNDPSEPALQLRREANITAERFDNVDWYSTGSHYAFSPCKRTIHSDSWPSTGDRPSSLTTALGGAIIYYHMSIQQLANTDPAPRWSRAEIARRAAEMLSHGAVVNLGIGIPSLCADFVPEGVYLRYQAENGVLGYGELLAPADGDPDLIDASGQFTKMTPGMAFFDSADSFAMIRGGHIDATVLGAMQVSERGDLANWMLPSRGIGSIGGGMDLAANTKRVIVAMEHTTKRNEPKILKKCDFPLTAQRCVTDIVTDIAVISVSDDGLTLMETAPGWNTADVQKLTAAPLR